MNERTTPETDKYANADWWTLFRATEHSRILERERDEAREESLEQARLLGISGERECRLIAERDELLVELEEYRSIAENIGAKKAVSEKEKAMRSRDEAIQKYDTLAVENMLEVNKICNQRDAAMDVLEEISLYLSSGIGDENTTAQQYKDRILDGIKHLAGHAWEEKCKYEKLWKKAEDALMKIEEIFIDGDDTYEDRKSMGQIARTFLEKTYESRTNQNN